MPSVTLTLPRRPATMIAWRHPGRIGMNFSAMARLPRGTFKLCTTSAQIKAPSVDRKPTTFEVARLRLQHDAAASAVMASRGPCGGTP